MKNGLEDYYVIRGNKKMRFGYTTGSCAAAACKGAAEILLGGVMHKAVTLMTPKGILLTLELKDIRIEGNQVTCAIQKDAGDDPDTTNGILVYATVQKTKEPGIILDQPVYPQQEYHVMLHSTRYISAETTSHPTASTASIPAS